MTDEYFVAPSSTLVVAVETAINRDLTFAELGVLVRLLAGMNAGDPQMDELADRGMSAAEFEGILLKLTVLGFSWQTVDRGGRPALLISDTPIEQAVAAQYLRGLTEGSGDD